MSIREIIERQALRKSLSERLSIAYVDEQGSVVGNPNMVLDDIDELIAECDESRSRELRNFRWAYSLLIQLAMRCQQDPDAMHAGDDWSGLVGTSHSMYFHRARDLAGISHDEFLEPIRSGRYEVDDLYDSSIEEE